MVNEIVCLFNAGGHRPPAVGGRGTMFPRFFYPCYTPASGSMKYLALLPDETPPPAVAASRQSTTSPLQGEVGVIGGSGCLKTGHTLHLPPLGGGRWSSTARTAGGGICSSLLLLAILPLLLAADWPRYLGPNRDGHSAETKLNWDWKNAPPKPNWAIDVGTGFAGVAVAGGKVFLFHRIGNEEILIALDPATGKEVWKFAYPTRYRDDFDFDNGPRCVPLVEGETVFTYGADGDLQAVEAATGKPRWAKNLLKEYAPKKGYFGIGSGPILLDGKLLVNVGAKGAGIVAFDPATGKELWKCADDGPSYSTPTSMVIEGKPHAVFFTRAGLLVVNAAGQVKQSFPWRARIDASVNAATPLVHEGSIFLSTSYNVGAILLKPEGNELTEVWKSDKSLSCHYNTPVRVGEYLFGIDGRQEGGGARLRCVAWKTGDVKWSVEKFGCASLIAVDGGILALTESGDLVGFDASEKAFAERGRVSLLKGTVRAAPVLSDGRLYVRNEKQLVSVGLK